MEKTLKYYQPDRAMHVFVASIFPDLLRLKKEGDVKSFNQKLLKVMPELERYVQKRLNRALSNHKINSGEYAAEDFIDQLFIEVYDHLDEVKEAKDLHVWLFKKADALVEDAIVEDEFDSLFFDNIDTYSKPEWDAMEEKFSVDGDGDFMMLEEMDDSSYPKQDYLLNHVFIEDKDQEIIRNLDKQKVLTHTQMVLQNLPIAMQKVFELFTVHKFDVPEIAEITNHTDKQVASFLEVTQEMLRTSFLKRHTINS